MQFFCNNLLFHEGVFLRLPPATAKYTFRFPMPQVSAVFASLMAFCLSCVGLLAQAGKADANAGKSAVHVRSIHFDPVKLGGQQNPWIRTQVELHANFNPEVRATPEADAGPKKPVNKNWVDKVKVTLTLIFKPIGTTTAAEFAYYRSNVTVLTMEINTDRSVYFYLPGDIIKRDRLKMQPDYYYVQVEVGGSEQPLFNEAGRPVADMANALHKQFLDKKIFDGARSEADRAVNANAGMLRPHFLVPSAFFDNLPQGSPQPEFIREEGSR